MVAHKVYANTCDTKSTIKITDQKVLLHTRSSGVEYVVVEVYLHVICFGAICVNWVYAAIKNRCSSDFHGIVEVVMRLYK